MIIDANMYWLPEDIYTDTELLEQFLSEIPAEHGWYGYLVELDGTQRKQIVIEKPKGYQNLNYIQGEYEIEKQLSDMDQAGIDKALLKIPCAHEWMSLDMCKRFNDGMAEHAKKSGGRMIPLAVVPPGRGKEAIEELRRCKTELGMNGVQLCAHYGEDYLDDPKFDCFFKQLNEYEMTAYIHHTPVPVQYDSFIEYNNLRRSYGRCADQTIAIGRELFSGLFMKYPKMKFVHSMLGGGFFAYVNMFFPPVPKGMNEIDRFHSGANDIKKCFEENIFFEISHAQPWGKKQLECAIEVLGADHILFGTSYPVRSEWHTEGAAFVKALDISNEEIALILSENAKRIYELA